jgi:hypothetical protein
MATYTKNLLSGSTNGKQIKVTGTSSGAAVTLHTAVSGTSAVDEIWLYACNTSSSAVTLTICWGGTTAPDNNMVISLPGTSGRVLVVDGALLQNGLVVSAFASTANVVVLDGFVNGIST